MRNVMAVRPMIVLIRSATTAEAVGIWPAPRPWKNTRPTASPTTRMALYAPRTSASGVPCRTSVGETCSSSPSGTSSATASSLML